MIFYTKCLCRTQDKLLAKKYRDLGYEVRDIRTDIEWRKHARSFNVRFPFVVVNGIAQVL